AIIFIGSGKISYGKLAQALDHGALTVQIAGDFDDAMQRVQQVARKLGIYLVNSVNPFRLEGQKTIMYRVLEALRWEPPDWIVVPGGNLGSDSYFRELAAGGVLASTIASAIEINHPVNLTKALRALDRCGGVVREATDQEIMDAKARVGAGGLGCEPASAASVAGARKLRQEGVIAPSDRVVCILT